MVQEQPHTLGAVQRNGLALGGADGTEGLVLQGRPRNHRQLIGRGVMTLGVQSVGIDKVGIGQPQLGGLSVHALGKRLHTPRDRHRDG